MKIYIIITLLIININVIYGIKLNVIKPIGRITDISKVVETGFLSDGKYLYISGVKANKPGILFSESKNGFRQGVFHQNSGYNFVDAGSGSFYFLDSSYLYFLRNNRAVGPIIKDLVFSYQLAKNYIYYQAVDKQLKTCYLCSTKYPDAKIVLKDLDVYEGSDSHNVFLPNKVFWSYDGKKALYYPTIQNENEGYYLTNVSIIDYPSGKRRIVKLPIASSLQWSFDSKILVCCDIITKQTLIVDALDGKLIKLFKNPYSSPIWISNNEISMIDNNRRIILFDLQKNMLSVIWSGSEILYNLRYLPKRKVIAFNTFGHPNDTLKFISLYDKKMCVIEGEYGYRIAGWAVADNGYAVVCLRNNNGKEHVNIYKYF